MQDNNKENKQQLPNIPSGSNPFMVGVNTIAKTKLHVLNGNEQDYLKSLQAGKEILPTDAIKKGEGIVFTGEPPKKHKIEYKGTVWMISDVSDSPNVIAVSNNVFRDKQTGIGLHGIFAVNMTNLFNDKPEIPFAGILGHWNKKIGEKSSFNINPGVLFDPNNDMELSKYRFLGNLTDGKITFRAVADLNKDGSFANLGVHGIYNLMQKSHEAIDISLGVNSGNNKQTPGARIQAGIQFRF